MFRFQWRLVVLLVILSGSVSIASAQTPAPGDTLMKAQGVADMTTDNIHFEAMSPDGSSIAWINGSQLCFLNLSGDSSQQNCVDLPPHYRGFNQYSDLSWSPDGKTLVFTEDPFILALDSDIWTYDLASGTFQDRTDDNVFGSWIKDSVKSSALIDYLPMWNPANGDLYFFRSTFDTSGNVTTALELMPLSRNEPKQAADYSGDLPTFSVYKAAVISPDGKQLAITVLSNDLKDARNGVYTVSLKDGSLNRVMTLDDFKLGLPDWAIQAGDFYPMMLQWAGNDGLIVSTQNQDSLVQSLNQMSYYVDLTSKKATPLVDFSNVPDAVAFVKVDNPNPPMGQMPRQGAVTPDGKHYLYVTTYIPEEADVYSMVLPPDGTPPSKIGMIDSFAIKPAASALPAISNDGKHALLYGYWLTFG